MKKSKTLLGMFLTSGLLLVGCSKEITIKDALEMTKNDFQATNFTYDMDVHTVVGTDGEIFLHQTTEIDGNKIHYEYNQTHYAMPEPQHTEMYFETGDVTYAYQKVSDSWQKSVYPMNLTVDPDQTFMGYTQLMAAIEPLVTFVDGNFYAENVTIQLNIDDFLARTMEDFSGYTKSPEFVDYTYDYIRIGVTNDHISLFEMKTSGYHVQSDDYTHTVTAVKDEGVSNVTKLSNFRNFGTTVVTLPSVE